LLAPNCGRANGAAVAEEKEEEEEEAPLKAAPGLKGLTTPDENERAAELAAVATGAAADPNATIALDAAEPPKGLVYAICAGFCPNTNGAGAQTTGLAVMPLEELDGPNKIEAALTPAAEAIEADAAETTGEPNTAEAVGAEEKGRGGTAGDAAAGVVTTISALETTGARWEMGRFSCSCSIWTDERAVEGRMFDATHFCSTAWHSSAKGRVTWAV
jgi:hypothetical protein